MFSSHRSLNIFVVLFNCSVSFCGKFEENYIVADNFVSKHIMVDNRQVQDKTFDDIQKAFEQARKTPYFDATPRTFHSFIVTSNRIATIEDLKNDYKKRRNGDKATIYFDDFHTARVAGINLKLKKGKTSMYEVVSCTQYDQGAIRVTARTFFKKNVTVFDIRHLNFVKLQKDMYCYGFHMAVPQNVCMNTK